MKKLFITLLVFVINYSYAQSVNEYKALIVPLKYDFLKGENQYRLNTLTKFNLNKAGFNSFYNNEIIPTEFNDRCSLLYVDVVKEKSFLTTKLYITFKDCNGKMIFQSGTGMSKEKEYQAAYTEALNKAFQSVNDLQYTYTGTAVTKIQPKALQEASTTVTASLAEIEKTLRTGTNVINKTDVNVLYAQPTTTGYQLIDSTPKVIMKVFNTSNKECYIAYKGNIQGVLVSKNSQWYFEYFQNDKLWSESVTIKF
ncbi:hypothetical protein [Flavobacterium sp. LB2P44]|uniref:hypothetical protein n=1 Tax=Flavobacterium sp. LB2P44 TaxID=3401713 RepID=UPI003AABAD97